MQSMGLQVNGNGTTSKMNGSPTKSNSHEQEQKIQQHQQQQQQPQQHTNGNMQRQHSTDSVNSNESNESSSLEKNKKKKGWVSLNSSFTIFLFNNKNSQHSCEVPLPKLFHEMPKSQKQIVTLPLKTIPTQNHLYLPHRRKIATIMHLNHIHRPLISQVHIDIFPLSKMPSQLIQ